MPTYQYECESHGSFTLLRPMSQSGAGADCPTCGEQSTRVITAPALFTMSPIQRDAAFRNERSRHEPRVRKSGHACGGRACASHDTSKPKLQSYTGPRPWVMEHR